jgi:hypothetical protein
VPTMGMRKLRGMVENGEDVTGLQARLDISAAHTRILLGLEDLTDWDMEELRHGRRRDRNGRFQGRPPNVLPKNLYDELWKRVLAEGQQKLLDMALPALDALRECLDGALRDAQGDVVMYDGHPVVLEVDTGRLRAIQEVLTRVFGKPEQKVIVGSEDKPYQKVERAVIDRSFGEAINTTAVEQPPPTPPRRRPKRRPVSE